MPELNKLPNEMQNEITGLIPLFIENLGNPKVSNILSNSIFYYSAKLLELILLIVF